MYYILKVLNGRFYRNQKRQGQHFSLGNSLKQKSIQPALNPRIIDTGCCVPCEFLSQHYVFKGDTSMENLSD